MVAAAVIGAGVLGAGATMVASSNASRAQQNAANSADQLQWQMYMQQRADQTPWRTEGAWGLNQLQSRLAGGFSPGDLTQDPGYQFGLNQGQLGINRAAAASGRYDSGAALKSLDQFNQDYAGTKYNDAFNRWVTQNNELAGLAGVGQTATNQTGQAAQNYANQAGQNITGAGNAAASGYLAQGNALSNALNSYAGYQMYQRNQYAPPNGWNFATSPYYGGADSTGGEL